jgi:hypothetical protein
MNIASITLKPKGKSAIEWEADRGDVWFSATDQQGIFHIAAFAGRNRMQHLAHFQCATIEEVHQVITNFNPDTAEVEDGYDKQFGYSIE